LVTGPAVNEEQSGSPTTLHLVVYRYAVKRDHTP